jgi:hypothetical protein
MALLASDIAGVFCGAVEGLTAKSSYFRDMITATPNQPLKNIIEFRPETGELAGHTYGIFLRVCTSPACDCGFTVLNFHATEDEGELVGALEANVHERTLKIRNGSPSLSAAVKETMDTEMQEADWGNLERGYYLYKNILAENFDVDKLDIDFPEELIDDPVTMQAYVDYLPAAAVFIAEKADEKFTIIDQYCVNPDCACTDSYFSVSKEGTEPAGFLYNYRSKKIDAENASLDIATATDFIAQLRYKNPDFDEQLAKRNRNMRSLFAKYLRKHKTQHLAPVFNAKKIGRNDPCTCGSGRKYKHCCGKSK